ncbi:MAG: hypothetical protein IJW44_03310 [Clostridia bacterium]|nr:hypothetical protein [Clostridia bacterium]
MANLICPHCYATVSDVLTICPECGGTIKPGTALTEVPEQKQDVLTVVKRITETNGAYRALSVVSVILNVIAVLLMLGAFVFFLAFFAVTFSGDLPLLVVMSLFLSAAVSAAFSAFYITPVDTVREYVVCRIAQAVGYDKKRSLSRMTYLMAHDKDKRSGRENRRIRLTWKTLSYDCDRKFYWLLWFVINVVLPVAIIIGGIVLPVVWIMLTETVENEILQDMLPSIVMLILMIGMVSFLIIQDKIYRKRLKKILAQMEEELRASKQPE